MFHNSHWLLRHEHTNHLYIIHFYMVPVHRHCTSSLRFSPTTLVLAERTLPHDFFFYRASLLLQPISRTNMLMLMLISVVRRHVARDLIKGFSHLTIFAICCKISIISENSGLEEWSCCQHLSSKSTINGWVRFGMIGLIPYNKCQHIN